MANNKKSVNKKINSQKKGSSINSKNNIVPKKKKNASTKNNTKNNTKSNSKNIKKSNYDKIQKKVSIQKSNEKIKNEQKKETKKQKQVVRVQKQEEAKKNKVFYRRILLFIISCLTKFKNLVIKFFKLLVKLLKKLGIFLKKIIIKFASWLKRSIVKIFKHEKLAKEEKRERKEKKKEIKKERKQVKKNNKEIIVDNKNDYIASMKSFTGMVLPITFMKGDRKKRKKVYLQESLLFAVLITAVDFVLFYKTSYFDMLHIFDNNIWNLIVTTFLTLLIMFIGSYILDYILTETILKIKRKKRTKRKK